VNVGLPVWPVAIGGSVLAVLLLASGAVILRQHDDLVTARLHDKDQQAIIYNLGRDIGDRDAKVNARAIGEAGDLSETYRACATDITSSFQKGVAFGRVIANAKPSPAAVGGKSAPVVVRDYREVRSAGAFKAAARPSAGSDLR
jgi:hypothetical protein